MRRMHSHSLLPLIAILLSAQASTLSSSTSLERTVNPNTSNDALPAPQPTISTNDKFRPPSACVSATTQTSSSPPTPTHPPKLRHSDEPHYRCKLPYTPMSLNYTLGATLSRSAMGAILISAPTVTSKSSSTKAGARGPDAKRGAGPVPAVQSRLGRSMPTTSTPSTAP